MPLVANEWGWALFSGAALRYAPGVGAILPFLHPMNLPTGHHRRPRSQGMTLIEVMIAMFVITIFTMSAFALALYCQKRTLANYHRLEAYQIVRTIAEHAMQVTYPDQFTPAGVTAADRVGTPSAWVWSNTQAANLRTFATEGSVAKLAYPTTGRPVVFTKTITQGTPFAGNNGLVLNVTVTWTFDRRNYSISVPIVRGG